MLSTFCPCLETYEAEFKGDELINLMEEIPMQHDIQVVSRILLEVFSQVYYDSQEQKVMKKN